MKLDTNKMKKSPELQRAMDYLDIRDNESSETQGPLTPATQVAQDEDGNKLLANRPPPKRPDGRPRVLDPRPDMVYDGRLALKIVDWLLINAWMNPAMFVRNMIWAGWTWCGAIKFGRVSHETYHLRRMVCDNCDKIYRDVGSGGMFCGSSGGCGTGCGHRRGADLTKKLTLASWKCPEGKFGLHANVPNPYYQIDVAHERQGCGRPKCSKGVKNGR
jgi:hypothetical protein